MMDSRRYTAFSMSWISFSWCRMSWLYCTWEQNNYTLHIINNMHTNLHAMYFRLHSLQLLLAGLRVHWFSHLLCQLYLPLPQQHLMPEHTLSHTHCMFSCIDSLGFKQTVQHSLLLLFELIRFILKLNELQLCILLRQYQPISTLSP